MFTRLSRLFNRISITVLCLVMTAQTAQAKPAVTQGLPQVAVPTTNFVYMSADGIVTEQFSFPASPTRDYCTLPAPILTSPVGGAQFNSLVPHFEWNQTGTGVVGYSIQVSAFSNFSNPVIDVTLSGFSSTNVSYVWSSNLLPGTTYYWRVAASCGGGGSDYSSTGIFQTADITGPFIDPPAIIFPSDGAVLFPSNMLVFSWGNVPGAESVQIHFYSSLSAAQNDQWMLSLSSKIWVNSYPDFTHFFIATGTYYWRLKVRDNIAWGPFSPIYSFTITLPAAKIYLPLIMRP